MKIGLCGFSRPGHNHHEFLAALEDINMILYYPHDDLDKHSLVEKGHVFVNSFDEIFKHNVDAIIIASEDHEHYEHILTALDYNIPILVDKPMVYYSWQVDNIINKKQNSQIFVGYPGRLFSTYGKVKSLIQDMQAEDVTGINCRIYAPQVKDAKNIMKPLHSIASHYIDCLNWLFEKDITCVQSAIFTEHGTEISGNSTLLINGKTPVFLSFEVNVSCFPEIAESNISIFTKQGTLVLGRNDFKYISFDKKPIEEYFEDTKQSNVSIEFVKAVKREPNRLCTLLEESSNVAVFEDIYEKAKIIEI